MTKTKKKCQERVFEAGGWGSHPCGNPAKYEDRCGVHATAKQKGRTVPIPQDPGQDMGFEVKSRKTWTHTFTITDGPVVPMAYRKEPHRVEKVTLTSYGPSYRVAVVGRKIKVDGSPSEVTYTDTFTKVADHPWLQPLLDTAAAVEDAQVTSAQVSAATQALWADKASLGLTETRCERIALITLQAAARAHGGS